MTGSILNILFLSVALALLVFALVFIIVRAISADRIAADKRLEELNKQEGDFADVSLIKHQSELTKKRKRRDATGNNFFEKFASVLYKELQAADIKMRPEEFLLIWMIVALVPACLVAMFVGNALLAIILTIAGVAVPLIIIKSKQKQRVKKFDEQLSDALMICCSCLRSGLSFLQAMETISKDMEAPISTEFDMCLKEIGMGASMDEALDNMGKRIKSKHLALMISAVLVQRQTGGNLSHILETLSNTIQDRMKLKKQLKTSTSSGKMSGMIVGAMPVILLVMFSIINYDFVSVLFEETRGNIALGIAAGLEILAFVAIKKITTIKM
jgi:tight adherence protein B